MLGSNTLSCLAMDQAMEKVAQAVTLISQVARETNEREKSMSKTLENIGKVLEGLTEATSQRTEIAREAFDNQRRPNRPAGKQPHVFSGKDDDWPAWEFVTKTYFGNAYLEGPKLLNLAKKRERGAVFLDSQWWTAANALSKDAQRMNQELYSHITTLVSPSSEALTMIKNTANGAGFE